MLVAGYHASLQRWRDTLGTNLQESPYCKGQAEPGIPLHCGPTLTVWHFGPCCVGNLGVAGSCRRSAGRRLLVHRRLGAGSILDQKCWHATGANVAGLEKLELTCAYPAFAGW